MFVWHMDFIWHAYSEENKDVSQPEHKDLLA